MLTPAEYHDLKLRILMDKCQTHAEVDPCDVTCAALDQAIDHAWQFSEMAKEKP